MCEAVTPEDSKLDLHGRQRGSGVAITYFTTRSLREMMCGYKGGRRVLPPVHS